MANFQIPIGKPEEIKPRLGKPELQWKKGRSAFELSTAWIRAQGIPSAVKTVLDQASEWQGAKLLEGIFERETDLPGKGRPSQTDLLAIVRLKERNAILGVESKVDEPFGELVRVWVKGAPAEKPDEPLKAAAKRQRSEHNRRERLVGAILLEQNDEWAVQRARHLTLESIAPVSDDLIV